MGGIFSTQLEEIAARFVTLGKLNLITLCFGDESVLLKLIKSAVKSCPHFLHSFGLKLAMKWILLKPRSTNAKRYYDKFTQLEGSAMEE